ncbi:hypothetical protein VroAM7_44600 [Vibrio rotiferianus]|uniref:Uncharacterized protein n=1 Tax=Vibrio rotiferianus TaxID=190895 RepID=A0A510IE32_9VIBR|nr:hypothetical protein [Vibrio rotiferianus]BBL91807.1 hypothetical protein VroAM7_44600 [Vibrio rotiferianus]
MNTGLGKLDMEVVDVLSSAIEEYVSNMSEDATDFEVQLAIKNVLSKKENEIAMKMQAAALFSVLKKTGV